MIKLLRKWHWIHSFSIWKDVQIQYTHTKLSTGKQWSSVKDVQEHTCIVCGRTERREI
jgi:hypothetical protein